MLLKEPSRRCTALSTASGENHGAAPISARDSPGVPGSLGENGRFASKWVYRPQWQRTRMWEATRTLEKRKTTPLGICKSIGVFDSTCQCRCRPESFLVRVTVLAPACDGASAVLRFGWALPPTGTWQPHRGSESSTSHSRSPDQSTRASSSHYGESD